MNEQPVKQKLESEKALEKKKENIPNPKMLVFGLDHDSSLWSNVTQNNTWFVENDERYIDLNSSIDADKVTQYNYSTTVGHSLRMSDKSIGRFAPPQKLIDKGPFDIIFIDGPSCHENWHPGRLIP